MRCYLEVRSIFTWFVVVPGVVVTLIYAPPQSTYVALNECFEVKHGHRINLTEAHMQGTESIQFKDDCLKACLRTLLQGTFSCRSLMHMPRDDDCVLAAQDSTSGASIEKIHDIGIFSPINYYENKCVQGPPMSDAATVAEVKILTFKGTRGVIQIASSHSGITKMFALLDGLRPNALLDINVRKEATKDCTMLRHKDIKETQRLLQAFTDSSGLAVLPWLDVDTDTLGKNFLGKTLLIIDTMTQKVIDCGVIAVPGDPDNFAKYTQNSAEATSARIVGIMAVAVVLVGYYWR